MNKLRNKLYEYESITMILGVIPLIVELRFATNYPGFVGALISPLSNISVYAAILIVSILIVLEMVSTIKNRDFDILFFILIILAGLYLMYRII